MGWWLRSLVTRPEDQGLGPSTLSVNSNSRGYDAPYWLRWALHTGGTQTYQNQNTILLREKKQVPHKKVKKAETSQLSHRSLSSISKCKQPVQVFTSEASQWTSSTRPFYCSHHRPRAPLAMFHTCWVRLDLQQSEIGTSMGKQVSDVDEASEESFLFFVNNQCVGFAVPETLPPQKNLLA